MFDRIDELINWYEKFHMDFTCVYFDEPDSTGHTFGPDSIEYKEKIIFMDSVFGYLLNSLERINILKNLNLVVVSDHGMAKTKGLDQFIFVKDYDGHNLIDFDKSVFGIVSNIFPKSNNMLDELYEKMKKIPYHKFYLKSNIPEEFHYSKSERIGPIVALADEGYRLMDENYTWVDLGAHGYLNNLTSIRAIFLAQGPNFKKGNIASFPNVNIYPLLCKLADIECNPNNGSTEIFEPFLTVNASKKLKGTNGLFYLIVFTVYAFSNSF